MSDFYGSPEGVAALSGVWTNNGEWLDADAYTDATVPSLADVSTWLEEVSAVLDISLAVNGFKVPVTQETAVKALDAIVNSLVADLCHFRNSSGRFFTDKVLQGGNTPMMIIRSDITDWVTANAAGLEAIGAERTLESAISQIGTKHNFPIFQREGFGNVFENWSGK